MSASAFAPPLPGGRVGILRLVRPARDDSVGDRAREPVARGQYRRTVRRDEHESQAGAGGGVYVFERGGAEGVHDGGDGGGVWDHGCVSFVPLGERGCERLIGLQVCGRAGRVYCGEWNGRVMWWGLSESEAEARTCDQEWSGLG